MKYAQVIRDFLSTLFGSKLVLQLRADLEEARRERDYFRGQFERMQLLSAPHRQAPAAPKDWRTTEPHGVTKTGGRKTWAMIQAENTETVRQQIEEEQKKKSAAAN